MQEKHDETTPNDVGARVPVRAMSQLLDAQHGIPQFAYGQLPAEV